MAFEDYVATKKDLAAILEGADCAWKPELEYIFSEKKFLVDTHIIAYDSKEIFAWQIKGPASYSFREIPHREKIEDRAYRGWSAGLKYTGFKKYLPKTALKTPVICGAPLTPFLQTHKGLQTSGTRPNDPYITKESFLATILHELAHIYYNQATSPLEKTTRRVANEALRLYKGDKAEMLLSTSELRPLAFGSELFAFCADYSTAKAFWPKHKEAIDRENATTLEKMLREEEEISLQYSSHEYAATLGRILIENYPKSWPKLIIEAALRHLDKKRPALFS